MSPHKITPPTTPTPRLGPSLPHPSPCLSYWHQTTRAFPHLNANRSQPVPSSVKYVIIGSGISGALTAFSLIEGGVNPENVIILEAREAVSGASGRNAGHVRPDAFRGFNAYSSIHGPEQALRILAHEKNVLQRIEAFVREHDVPCDFHLTTTFDVCLSEEFAAYEADSFQAFKAAGGDVSGITLHTGEDAKKKTRVNDAVAAYEWAAGSSHPAKLAQFLLSQVLEKGARLWTHCLVTNITPGHDGHHPWEVQTSRGTVSTEKVIHCTNAYAAALIPDLADFLTPNRAQAHSIIPGPAFSGEKVLRSTMSLRYSPQHYYSLIQRQLDGTIIFGVSRLNPDVSPETAAGRITFNDSSFSQEIADIGMRRFGILFPTSNDQQKDNDAPRRQQQQQHGEGLDHAWTGIIGMTPDLVPCVGAIPELPGQYVCAGFNGHGMAHIFACAPGVAKLVLGHTWADTGLPECFRYSRQRVKGSAVQVGRKGGA